MSKAILPEGLKRVLDIAQGDLPPCDRPFAAWAGQAGVGESEMCAGILELKERGVIRRFGGVFDSRAMGLFTTLVGARVPEDGLEAALSLISALEGATHVYLRDHELNVWFTLAAESEEAASAVIESLRAAAGIEAWSMPMTKKFKLEVRFDP